MLLYDYSVIVYISVLLYEYSVIVYISVLLYEHSVIVYISVLLYDYSVIVYILVLLYDYSVIVYILVLLYDHSVKYVIATFVCIGEAKLSQSDVGIRTIRDALVIRHGLKRLDHRALGRMFDSDRSLNACYH